MSGRRRMSQPQRLGEDGVEIARQDLAQDSTPEEVGPHEFHVWLGGLGETAEVSDLAGQTPEGIIDQVQERLRYLAVADTTAATVERMNQRSVIHHRPKLVLPKMGEVRDRCCPDILTAFVKQSASDVMMVDDEVTGLGPQNGRHDVPVQIFFPL